MKVAAAGGRVRMAWLVHMGLVMPFKFWSLNSGLPIVLTAFAFAAGACKGGSSTAATSEQATAGLKPAAETKAATLTLGAYSTPREAYGKDIIPKFTKAWSEKHGGRELKVEESYQASGAQARAIIGGFEADVTALSLEPDVVQLEKAGLITHNFRETKHQGIVTTSVVVIGVREGNPKGIKEWADLAKPGVEVLTPNVKTSGGAMWNILAIYGAGTRGKVVNADDADGAAAFLGTILGNVRIMDASARESLLTFERGVGDAIITYENEVLEGLRQGKKYEIVVPSSTILIENPIAIVDRNAKAHGTEELAKEFLDYVWSPDTQRAFASRGYRPVDEAVKQETQALFKPVNDLFTVRDLGGWDAVKKGVFGESGVYDKALEQSKGNKGK
jgi:sulfate transport system substrate-binding protein